MADSKYGTLAVGGAVFVLWVLLAGENPMDVVGSGLAVAVAAAVWSRLLDA